MSPHIPDPPEPMERRQMRRGIDAHPQPDEPAHAHPASLLSRLVELVTVRAGDVAGAHAADPEPMERLRESVEALGNVLDALRLVRGSGPAPAARAGETGSPRAGTPSVQPPAVWGRHRGVDDRAPADERPHGGQFRSDESPPAYAPFRDQLTGLHSRAGFEEVAGGDLGRCLRHGRPFSIARIRLASGNPSLVREAGGRLRRGLRGSDLVALDGEREFMLTLAETSADEAGEIARRLVRALRTADGVPGGAWVGTATGPEDGSSLDALLRTARSRMAGPPASPGADLSRRS